MNANRSLLIRVVIGLVLLGTGAAYGFLVGKAKIFPYQLIKRAHGLVFADDESAGGSASRVKKTMLYPLRITAYDWPVAVERYSRGGGAITRLGDRVLGVDKHGEFFVFGPDNRIRTLGRSIDTNMEDLARKGEELESNTPDVLRVFRFLDIAVQAEAGRTHLFVSYHYWHSDRECKTTRVSRSVIDDFEGVIEGAASLADADWQLIFESRPCLEFSHEDGTTFQSVNNGGRLVPDMENGLYLSLGDNHLDGVEYPEIASQTDELDYGKIFRIDLESLEAEVHTYGHRNPQGLILDAAGNLWETEHGPRGGDELNLIKAGANYGWPRTTFGVYYTGYSWPLNETPGRHRGYEPPVFAWSPGIGISNLVRIEDRPALWAGDLLISALRTGSLYRLHMQQGRVLVSEQIQIRERIRDMTLMGDGSIVLWTDSRKLLRLVAEPQDDEHGPGTSEGLAAIGVPQDLQQVVSECMACHSFSADVVSDDAPSLWEIHGRSIGTADYGDYSNALRNRSDQAWDAEALTSYIENPERFAPGTTMPPSDVGDAATLEALVDYLKTLR